MKKLASVILMLLAVNTFAQNEPNVINTAAPFLSFSVSSQMTGLGEIGVVTTENNFISGVQENPALLKGDKRIDGFSVSQRSSFEETYYYSLSLIYSISDKWSVGYAYNYYDLGTFIWEEFDSIHSHNAKQYYHSLRLGYALTDNIGLGVGMKYFVDDIYPAEYFEDISIKPAKSYVFDIGLTYDRNIGLPNNYELLYGIGADIINLGPKVAYGHYQELEFIPTEFNVGVLLGASKYINKTKVGLNIMYQADKLLVPTRPEYDEDLNIIKGKDPDRTVFNALFSSFYDAPGGFKEETQEISHHFGTELYMNINNNIRGTLQYGRFAEHKYKGNRKYHTAGIGFEMKGFVVHYSLIFDWKDFKNEHTITISYILRK